MIKTLITQIILWAIVGLCLSCVSNEAPVAKKVELAYYANDK